MKQIVTIKNFLDGKLISERKQTRVVYRDEVGFSHIRQYVGHGGRYVKRQVVDGVCEIHARSIAKTFLGGIPGSGKSFSYRSGPHCPAWLCLVESIRAMCSSIELELGKRYGNSKNVKALRILSDIRKSSVELDNAIDQLEGERDGLQTKDRR
jgi:hypothetical protein